MIGKLRWIFTSIGFFILKKSLHYRLKGSGACWLQQINVSKPSIVNREDFIINYCSNKNILHIGFTDFPFTEERLKNNKLLHAKIGKVAANLYGVDNDKQAIEKYVSLTNDSNVFFADVTQYYPEEVKRKNIDTIVFAEVLEHLQNPHQAVKLLMESFDRGTEVLVTVPNYTALDSIAASLNNTESIHPHHYWYFSPYTLLQLFNKEKFTLKQLHFGMYYEEGKNINVVLKNNSFMADCIIAVFTLK